MSSTFINAPLTIQDVDGAKTTNYGIYIKPTPEKEYYRFRLLWFTDKSDRKTPFFTRFVHEYWDNQESGKNIMHDIICPTTPHVRKTWAGDAFEDCPICRFMNNNFIAWKDSGYKDKLAAQNYKGFKKRFQAIIPVYVISDPEYDPNNGKLKVFVITDSAIFDKFKALVVERSSTTNIFNGDDAVDFLVRAAKVEKIYAEGKPEENVYYKTEIVQMGFTSKPYSIATINKETVDAFPFADYYYNSPTANNLKSFYKSYCLQTIDDDSEDLMADVASIGVAKSEPAKKEADAEVENLDEENLEDVNINEEVEEIEEEPAKKPAKTKKESAKKAAPVKPSDDIDEDMSDVVEEVKPKDKRKPKVTESEDSGEIDVDNLLADIGI